MLRLLVPMRTTLSSLNRPRARNLMRAVRIHEFGEPEVLRVERIPEPSEKDDEVCKINEDCTTSDKSTVAIRVLTFRLLVEVKAAGINPVDTYIRQGIFRILPSLPAILGKEVAGIVRSTGSKVTRFKPGDRVYCCLPFDGGYAEMTTCPENMAFPLSEKLSFGQGSCLYVAYFTAYRALVTKSHVQKGDKVFIHGASGTVGIAATQIAKKIGATVVGTVGSASGKAAAERAGVDFVFNHRERDYLFSVSKVVGEKGFDVIIENAAHINLGCDLRLLAPRGRLVIVGSRGDVTVTPRDLMFSEATVTGVQLACLTPEDIRETSQVLLEGANSGWINPIIEKEFDFSQAIDAHKQILSRRASGKLIFAV